MIRKTALALAVLALPFAAHAQASAAGPDSGDTAWIMAASALVLLMTLPGLGLFYGGLVRAKNVLSVLLQVGAVAAVASLVWIVAGYTFAFGDVTNGWLGNGRALMMAPGNLFDVRPDTTLPESAFSLFEMTFAAITPALMVGAWVDRARFSWVIVFTGLWSLVVYAPVAHWIWGGGWLSQQGAMDFAGGIVVHTTAGVSAIVVALLLGRRQGFPGSALLPHAPGLTMLGAMMLWVGWFGFNGGSALTASDDAASAIINTHAAAAAAAMVWIAIERVTFGKPTTVGFATGAIAGLATVTPMAGYISPGAALLVGAIAAAVGAEVCDRRIVGIAEHDVRAACIVACAEAFAGERLRAEQRECVRIERERRARGLAVVLHAGRDAGRDARVLVLRVEQPARLEMQVVRIATVTDADRPVVAVDRRASLLTFLVLAAQEHRRPCFVGAPESDGCGHHRQTGRCQPRDTLAH